MNSTGAQGWGMTGASSSTRSVAVVNANWEAGPDGTDGVFSFMIVTDDQERHVVAPSPTAATAILAVCASGAPLMWDPEARTLLAGGLVGSWFEKRTV